MAMSKPLLTEFGIHHRMESCGQSNTINFSLTCNSQDDSLLVATGGQDHLIRVWKLIEVTANGNKPENDQSEIKLKEVVFEVGERDANCSGSRSKMSARVETILSGHEDRVTDLNFFTGSDTQALRLLSSSMDKTMIVWKPSSENEGKL